MTFYARWSAGADARATTESYERAGPPCLVLSGGVNKLVLIPPISTAAYPAFADFLRELARNAHQIAASMDPDGELTEPSELPKGGRLVLLVRDEDGESGGGYKP